jgi:two-component system, chemotaxis family, CheB/CheR fusion protein
MSRLQMGKLETNRQTLSVAPIIKDAVDTVRAEAQAKNISLEMKLPIQPVFVHADAVRLRQIIWNLLNNAVKSTDRDGRVEISLEEPSDGEAKLSISDNGKGIDPRFLPYVFEMFRQADASTTRNHGGMGIGLALVRQLVEIHDGRIEAYSAGKGRGARFTIFLPLRSEGKSNELTAKLAGQQLTNLSVLIVDDSLDTIEMLRKLLELEGAIAETATTGSEALEILRQKKFDLLISDISMPEMDGFELLRRIRTQPTTTKLPAVALTGFGRAEDAKRADTEGFAAHLTKPIDLNRLIETIHHVLVSQEHDA